MSNPKAYRVDFDYEDAAFLHIVANTEEEARIGGLQMLKTIKNPNVTKVTEVNPDGTVVSTETPEAAPTLN